MRSVKPANGRRGERSNQRLDSRSPSRTNLPQQLLRLLVEVCEGVFGGIAVFVVLCLSLSVVPMIRKRAEVTSHAEQGKVVPTTDMSAQRVREPETNLPPVSYELTCDGNDLEIRDALIDEISSMRTVPALWPPDWLTLPMPVLPAEGKLGQSRVGNIVTGIYADYPELSVYTDGQCCAVEGFLSQWRLGGEVVYEGSVAGILSPWRIGMSDEPTQEERLRERNDVTERLDSVARELADATESGDYAEEKEALGSDGLYTALAYRWVGSHTRYSDGQDDTRHANDVYGAMFEEESQCYGTACALKALLERGGIPAFVATGDHPGSSSEAGHAWVIARMGGQWFSIDGTGAQVLQDGDPIDLGLIRIRRGKWQSFMEPLAESLGSSDLEIDPLCLELMERYEKIAEPIEKASGVPDRAWLRVTAPPDERDEEYRSIRMAELTRRTFTYP